MRKKSSKKNNSDAWKENPQIIRPRIDIQSPNESFTISKGEYSFVRNEKKFQIIGTIEFVWTPRPAVRFKGVTDINIPGEFFLDDFQMFKDDVRLGYRCQIYRVHHDANFVKRIEGLINGNVVFGDRSIRVDKVQFELVNFRDFVGSGVKDETTLRMNRLVLENDKHKIIIDKRADYNDLLMELKNTGGYIPLYTGILQKKSGRSISFKESNDVINCMKHFLDFLNGRRCSALFQVGIYKGVEKWKDYTPSLPDPYKYVTTWPRFAFDAHLNDMWKRFYELYQDEGDRDCLTSIIYWYVEANGNTSRLEASIVMVQNALELMYNWLIVEKRKIIIGEESLNLSASNKIRLLLSQINVEATIPESFVELQKYSQNKKGVTPNDAPEILVYVRNAIVHSSEVKRKALIETSDVVKSQVTHLGIWYIELIMLHIFGYQGKYFNRTDSKGDIEQSVPWVVPIKRSEMI